MQKSAHIFGVLVIIIAAIVLQLALVNASHCAIPLPVCEPGGSCDVDGDGFSRTGGGCGLICGIFCSMPTLDCVDSNPAINPGIAETGCLCFDNINNNCFFGTDESDPGCVCMNGLDDQGNSLVDCADPFCLSQPYCTNESLGNTACGVSVCADSFDNDGDTFVDINETSCLAVVCGNNITEQGEECDDGNQNNFDSCRNTCTLPFCGDNLQDAGEECDDGNTNDGDGCDEVCQLECPQDDDNDEICNAEDDCPNSLPQEPVDADGCDIFQFCNRLSCGTDCSGADWNNNEPQNPTPNDCTVIIVHRGGLLQAPMCVPTEFNELCAG